MSASVFEWLQSTRVAVTIAGSTPLLAGLSAVHLVGFALLMGGALVSSLRMMGLFFADQPLAEIAAGPNRGVAVGLAISTLTGLLLFSARASGAAENGWFQLKMVLLVGAAVCHFGLHRAACRRSSTTPGRLRAVGVAGLALWVGVALAGCAFIFLE